MNHFIYSMNSTDPAPATGGNTKGWFFHYKWDVDDFTYIPVAEEDLRGYALQGGGQDLLWFVMDKQVLGFVRISSMLPALSGGVELHYDTRARIDCIEAAAGMLPIEDKTGTPADPRTFDNLYQYFDATVFIQQSLREKAGST